MSRRSGADEPHIAYFNMGPWPFYCGFTTSKKAFAKEMERLGVDPVPPFFGAAHANATVHYLEKDGCPTMIVTMVKPGKRSTEQVAGLLAHEATHVVQELWAQLGEREPGREAEAYLVQMIVQCCLQIVYKTGRVRKSEP